MLTAAQSAQRTIGRAEGPLPTVLIGGLKVNIYSSIEQTFLESREGSGFGTWDLGMAVGNGSWEWELTFGI
jgi:hypothetical protein